MQVKLRLFGNYAVYLPPHSERGVAVLSAPAGATVESVLDSIDLPQSARQYVAVNGERARHDLPLHDGDEVRVIVALGGG